MLVGNGQAQAEEYLKQFKAATSQWSVFAQKYVTSGYLEVKFWCLQVLFEVSSHPNTQGYCASNSRYNPLSCYHVDPIISSQFAIEPQLGASKLYMWWASMGGLCVAVCLQPCLQHSSRPRSSSVEAGSSGLDTSRGVGGAATGPQFCEKQGRPNCSCNPQARVPGTLAIFLSWCAWHALWRPRASRHVL